MNHLGEIISLLVALSWTVTALFADKANPCLLWREAVKYYVNILNPFNPMVKKKLFLKIKMLPRLLRKKKTMMRRIREMHWKRMQTIRMFQRPKVVI